MIYKLGEYIPKIGKNNYIAENARDVYKRQCYCYHS